MRSTSATSSNRDQGRSQMGDPMDFSAKLDSLQQHLTKTKSDAEAAAKETRDKVKDRVDQAQADVEKEAKAAQANAQGKWAQMKADHHARMQDLRAKIDQRNAQLDAAAAEGNADWAESDA